MRRFWGALAEGLTRRAVLVLVLVVAVTAVLALGLPKLTFATGQDSYINADEQVSIDNVEYQKLFGGEGMVTLFTADQGKTVVDLFTPDNIAQLREVQQRLEATPGVQGVVSPLTVMEYNQALVEPKAGSSDPTSSVAGGILLDALGRETDPAGQAARSADAATTLQRFQAAAASPGGTSLDNPDWVRFLLLDNQGEVRKALRPFFVFAPGTAPTLENATHAQMVTRLNGNQTLDEQGAATVAVVNELQGRSFPGFTVLTTGAPVLLKEINDYLQKGMLTLGAIAVLVMVIVLAFVFRVRWRLLPLAVMLTGVVWTFGILGFTGFRLSLVTISGLPILIGLGVEFAIQVHNRIEEEVVRTDATPASPFVRTQLAIAPALAVAAVAGVIATISLKASRVPMIRDFGVLLALGVAFVFIGAIVVPIATLALREKHKPSTEYHHQPVVEKSMVALGRAPAWSAVPLALLGVALFVGGLFAEQNTRIETNAEAWIDQSSAVIKDLDVLKEQTGSSSELGVYLQDPNGVFNDQMAAFMTNLSRDQLAANPGRLLTASSLTDTVSDLMNVPGATPLPPTGANLQAAYAVAPEAIQQSVVSPDGKAANLIFRTGPSALEERKVVVDDIKDNVTPPPPIKATASGLAVVGVGLLDNLTANRLLLTYLAIGGVAIWLLLRFLSFIKAGLVLVPVLLAVGLAAVVVRALNITVSPLTTVSGPLVIAICTEFACLILFRHIEERRAGLAPREAADQAASHTGRAFFASSLTTVGGFAVLMASPMPLLRDFGAIVALTIAIALLSAIVVLPPVLVFADEHGWLRLGDTIEGEPNAPDEPEPAPRPDAEAPEPAAPRT